MMKKLFKLMAGVLMTALLSFSLVSCDKDDNPEPEPMGNGTYTIKLIESTENLLVYEQKNEIFTVTYNIEFDENNSCTKALVVIESISKAALEEAFREFDVASDDVRIEGNKAYYDMWQFVGLDRRVIEITMEQMSQGGGGVI